MSGLMFGRVFQAERSETTGRELYLVQLHRAERRSPQYISTELEPSAYKIMATEFDSLKIGDRILGRFDEGATRANVERLQGKPTTSLGTVVYDTYVNLPSAQEALRNYCGKGTLAEVQ